MENQNTPASDVLGQDARRVLEVAAKPFEITSRITVILHPNDTIVSFNLNDRMFNLEHYMHSRKREPEGAERKMFQMIETHIIGIRDVHAGKNSLRIELTDGMKLFEFIPQVLVAVTEFGRATEPGYKPDIYVDDQRYKVEPVYDESSEWGRVVEQGARYRPGEANIGVPYKVFLD